MKTEQTENSKYPPKTKPRSYRKLWISLIVVLGLSFLVLGYYGSEIYRKAPPIPKRVVTADGQVLFTAQEIKDGQNVWQSIGGQEVGSVWGHGAYVAPDWTADWLHREATALLDRWAVAKGAPSYDALEAEAQAALRARLQKELRTNTNDAASGNLVVSEDLASVIDQLGAHYASLFGNDEKLAKLREAYAIPPNSI